MTERRMRVLWTFAAVMTSTCGVVGAVFAACPWEISGSDLVGGGVCCSGTSPDPDEPCGNMGGGTCNAKVKTCVPTANMAYGCVIQGGGDYSCGGDFCQIQLDDSCSQPNCTPPGE